MFNLTDVLSAVITLAVALITTFVIPYLKQKVGTQKIQKVYNLISLAVEAAEMIYKGTGMGEKKKAYVLKYLTDKGIDIDFGTLDNMIESAVYNLQTQISE